jgi:autotransporter-associated beta strand protein
MHMFGNAPRRWFRHSKSLRPLAVFRPCLEQLEDLVLPSTFTVTSTADSGANTLRQAILDSNGTSGLNTIKFNISGSGVHTIQPTSALPLITNPVIIDGTTQPGYAGSPLIQLDGSLAGTNVNGLYITAGGSTVKGLDLSRFAGSGLVLQTAGGDTIQANYLGTDPTGTSAEGNRDQGLLIFGGSANNQIVQNVISANGATNQFSGVFVGDTGTNGNDFFGNFIGTNSTGTAALGNGGVGIYIANGAENNLIGTNGDGINDTAERNIISGNGFQGVAIQGTSSGANTTGNIVAGDYIGTNAAGTAALANGNNGVFIYGGAQNNRIGTNGTDADAAGEKNLISGNKFQGVSLSDAATSSNVVAGNLIGTDVTGTVALANADGGIDILNGASSNRIGFDGTSSSTVAALERNVISGNGSTPGFAGIFVSGAGTNLNVIVGNYVGVDASGAKALGNSGVGVYLSNGAQNNRIGSDGNGVADASKSNVISGNAFQGLAIQGTSSGANTTGNIVAGNFIGTNAAGTGILGNANNGIWINSRAQSNRIGTNGTDADPAGEGNVIGGNSFNGVLISDAGTNLNQVAGNWIGTDKTGTLPLPNSQNGVTISNGAQGNQVGGSSVKGNVIAFNTQAGVSVVDPTTTGNSIRANSILSNGGLGIDLGSSGVQVNHGGTTTGPNNLQNYPLITAGTPGSTTAISGLFNSLPTTTYTLDFYANTTPDVTFYGPGQRYLGSTSVTTDASGNATFSVNLSAATSTNEWVTATATDPAGNTSEFSGARQLPASPLTLSRTTWTAIGPGPIAQSPEFTGPVMSGRVETAAPDPTNSNVMYLAADGGGVWKTTNWLSASPTWTPLTDSQTSTVTGSGDLAYKSLVVFPGNPSIMYAAIAGPGGGILKSTDGGTTWTLLGNSVFNQVAFGSLIVDPNNANNLFVTVWYGPNSNSGGVYKSTDGGVTWTNTTAAIHTGAASDIVMDPTNSMLLYAGLTQGAGGGTTNGLYKSTNGGTTWTRLAGGLLTGSAVGVSIRVTVAPSSPQTLYATVFDPALGNPPNGLPHRFRSTDGGTTWTSLPALPTAEESRYWHIMLSVDPSNSQTIYVNGDHSVYQSTNGGSSWTLLNNSEDPVGGFFDDSGALILVGDHGIYRGTNFVNKQGNLQTSEFYTLTLDPTNPNTAYGLAQDQFAAIKYTGYPVWNSTGQAPNFQDGGGAGETGKILVNPTNPHQLFRYAPTDTSSFILLSNDAGASWVESGTGIPTTLAGYGLAYASQKAFVMDPGNSQRVLVATNRVYETTNSGASWKAISPVLSPSSNLSDQYITSLAIAPSLPNTIYAATADGRVFVTQNDGGAWTEIDKGLPKDSFDQIVSMQVDPNNANRVFIVPGRFPTNVFGSTHVWMTTTGGSSGWTDITGNLPVNDWTNSIAVDWRPATPSLYVATARGVYQSTNLGGSWSLFGQSLPNSPVTDLQLVPGFNILAAATYGRGVWEIQLGTTGTRVWTGQSSTSSNWSDPANWSGNIVPNAGDSLVFGPGASRLTNTGDLTAGTQFALITFSSAGYAISGNAVTLSGNLDASSATGNNTFNDNVTLGGADTVLTGGASTDLTLGGAINNAGFTMTVGGGTGRVDLTGAIGGTGGLTENEAGGTMALSGAADTYTGATTVQAGTLLLGKSGTAVTGALTDSGGTVRLTAANQVAATSAVTVSSSGLLDLNNNSDTISSLTLNSASMTTGTGTLTLGGNVTDTGTSSISGNLALGAAGRTFTVNTSATLNVSAVVSGGVGLSKSGMGTLVLSAANTYSGGTTLTAGTLTVGNNTALGTGGLTLITGTLGSTGTAITLANPVTLNGNITLAGSVGLTFNSAIPLTANRTLTVTNSAGVTLQGGVTDSGTAKSLTLAGSGKLILPVADTYSGGTILSGGTLIVGNNGSLGTGALTVTTGALTGTGSPITLSNAVTLGGNLTVGGTVAMTFNGAVTLTGNRTLTTNNAALTTIAGSIGQSGGARSLTKAGSGELLLQAANTYSGGTVLSTGTLTLGNNSALGTGTLTINSGTIKAGASSITLANALSLAGNFTVAGTNALTFSGAATLTGARTVTTTNSALTTFSGNIGQSSSGLGLTKAGAGTLVLSGTNTYTGTTTIKMGMLLVNGTQSGSAVSVASSGTLGGTGVVGNVSVLSGGHVAPGISSTQTGVLTAANVTLASGSGFNLQANGTTAGSGYSQLSASGTVNITGSTLNFTLGFTPVIGNAFTIINNTGAGAVVGTFKGLPQNATFTLNGMTFQISYTGGTGNDVVVSRTA